MTLSVRIVTLEWALIRCNQVSRTNWWTTDRLGQFAWSVLVNMLSPKGN